MEKFKWPGIFKESKKRLNEEEIDKKKDLKQYNYLVEKINEIIDKYSTSKSNQVKKLKYELFVGQNIFK